MDLKVYILFPQRNTTFELFFTQLEAAVGGQGEEETVEHEHEHEEEAPQEAEKAE